MIPSGVRIFLCTTPVDFRFGFDRLAQTARERIGHDPQMGGMLVVFANRRATRLRVLWFERNGFCMLYKRLHGAVFDLPAAADGAMSIHIEPSALAKLLAGVPRQENRSENRSRRSRAA